MQTGTELTADPVVRRLLALGQEQPALLSAVTVYESLLPVLRDAVFDVIPLAIDASEARACLAKGRPILAGRMLEVDLDAQRDLLIGLARSVEKAVSRRDAPARQPLRSGAANDQGSAAGRIRAAFEQNRLDVRTLMASVASGAREGIKTVTAELGLDEHLVWLLLQNALKPSLRVWHDQLAPMIAGVSWRKSFCPICGSAATLGELQGNYQEKHLRCGACGADWTGRRLVCACCGSEDHRTQRCLYVEGQRDRMSVDACDACNGYLKIISAFSPTPVELLAIEDLATASLDRMAQEQGYRRLAAPA